MTKETSMKIEEGNIMTFTLLSGMELIGKVRKFHENELYLELTDTFMVMVQQGQDADGNFATQVRLQPLSPFAFEENKHGGVSVNLYLPTVLLSINPPEQLTEQYARATGNIIAPQKSGIQLP